MTEVKEKPIDALKAPLKDLPYELRQYIGNEHQSIGESNACDYRPTYKAELDSATEDARRGYANTLVLLAKIPEDEQRTIRLFAEWALKTEYRLTEFRSFDLINRDPNSKNKQGQPYKWVSYVGPNWLRVYDDYLKVKGIMTGGGVPSVK